MSKINQSLIIRDLQLESCIGCYAHEKERAQALNLSLRMQLTDAFAYKTDQLQDAVDYDSLQSRIREFAKNSRFELIEAMGYQLLKLIFDFDSKIEAVTLQLEKPGSIAFARCAAIEMAIDRSSFEHNEHN